MTTPQDPARRKKQKRRRETQLANWRAKNDAAAEAAKPADAPAKKGPARAARAS